MQKTYRESGLILREDARSSGFVEIVVYCGDTDVVAIISRQCVGGKWCLYPYKEHGKVQRFRAKKAAVGAAASLWAAKEVA